MSVATSTSVNNPFYQYDGTSTFWLLYLFLIQFYPIYISRDIEDEDEMDLLLIKDADQLEKQHYVLIKYFNRMIIIRPNTKTKRIFARVVSNVLVQKRYSQGIKPASFPVVLGDFGCDVTCQVCRESSPRTPGK